MRRLSTVSAGLLCAVLAVGCRGSGSGDAGSNEDEGVIESAKSKAASVVLPVEEEKQLGEKMAAQIEQELQLVDDPELTGYVQQLGREVVRAAGDDVPEGIDIAFEVVRDDQQINAFAIPGGTIYVYTGLLRAVDSEAELLAVLSHEVAHVTERHIAEQLAAQYGIETLAAVALGRDAGVLGQLVGAVAGQGFLLKYSRDHEEEADAVGLGYETRAGWDPNGYVSFFEELAQLEQQGGGGWIPSFLQTHPASADRVEAARDRIAKLDDVPTKTGEDRYQQFKQRELRPSGAK